MAVMLSLVSPSAHADDGDSSGTSDETFWVEQVDESQQSGSDHGAPQQVDDGAAGPHIVIGEQACPGAEAVVGTQSGESDNAMVCGADEPPALTAEDVRRAFAELKLPAGTLTIQPPDGLTLVNFRTNFYTTSTDPISTTVTLLGQPVTLEATPATFVWHFGDGESRSTTEPGAPYPDLTITHNYLRKGEYLPSLSTTYTGRYRIADGGWQAIPGTVTIDGQGQSLRAIEAEPKLVGY
ncbi:hypothetical protein RB608_22760 [Nocardioides sp. LHD-245]|uniref:PKD domain-containing protein n=1 Tax=Nocardioides sp. LHD-245 TaxID=3051387 RepID=UPI0027E214DD|nr:hypothetical protein [Nocardioides sp. LHD-245]